VESKPEKETVIPYDMGNHGILSPRSGFDSRPPHNGGVAQRLERVLKTKAQGSSVTVARFKSVKGAWLKGKRLRIDI